MAVYTPVSPDQLTRFLRAYDLGALLRYTEIAEGIENSNFCIDTEQGRYILTLFEKRVREADLPFFLALMSHLRERGLPCPRPVAARDGRALRRLNGRAAVIVTFLPGRAVTSPGPAQTRDAGAALARLHAAARDFTGARRNDLGPSGWRTLYTACETRADNVLPGLAALLAEELRFLERAWPHDLPGGVIHADLFPDNVLYTNDAVTGVIDFYFAAADLLTYDLAICLNAWCFDSGGGFRPAHAKALLEGYRSVRPLAAVEQAALPVLARGAAMRFLLTRLYDRLHPEPGALVTPRDPLHYLDRLRFHQTSDWLRACG